MSSVFEPKFDANILSLLPKHDQAFVKRWRRKEKKKTFHSACKVLACDVHKAIFLSGTRWRFPKINAEKFIVFLVFFFFWSQLFRERKV